VITESRDPRRRGDLPPTTHQLGTFAEHSGHSAWCLAAGGGRGEHRARPRRRVLVAASGRADRPCAPERGRRPKVGCSVESGCGRRAHRHRPRRRSTTPRAHRHQHQEAGPRRGQHAGQGVLRAGLGAVGPDEPGLLQHRRHRGPGRALRARARGPCRGRGDRDRVHRRRPRRPGGAGHRHRPVPGDAHPGRDQPRRARRRQRRPTRSAG